jgi:membrane protein
MSPDPAGEPRPERIRDGARQDLEAAEEAAEQAAGDTLKGRPRLAGVAGLIGGVVHEQGVEQVGLAASGAAFWLVISVFPTAIAAISLFGLVVSPEQVAADLGKLATGAPASLSSLVTNQLRRVAATDHAGLSAGLALSVLFAIWSASAGVYNLDRAIRQAYGLPHQSYVQARGRAFAGAGLVVLTLGLGALSLSVILAHTPPALVLMIGFPFVLAGMTVGIAFLYWFSVGGQIKVRALIPGAFASAVGVIALVAGFGVYVAWSRRYTAVYGVFAGAVIGMVGTYLAVYVVLLGAVFNMQLPARAGRK